MYVIWEIIVVVMVVIVLTMSVKGIANNTTYWKKYHSADIALMSDLVIGSQGDFVINYNMKDLQKNWVTNALRIDPLIFQIFFQKNAVFVYDTSIDKDRFPQSYTFAEDNAIKIFETNTTSDYVVLYKTGDTVSLESEQVSEALACPSEDTSGNLSEKKFDVITISDGTKKYSDYASILLKNIGNGATSELLITLANTTTEPTTIYYDLKSQIKGQKMSCLIRKHLLTKFPDMNVQVEPYYDNNPLEVAPFTTNRDSYVYWILIKVNTAELSKEDLSNNLKEAIVEYYGKVSS